METRKWFWLQMSQYLLNLLFPSPQFLLQARKPFELRSACGSLHVASLDSDGDFSSFTIIVVDKHLENIIFQKFWNPYLEQKKTPT